MPIVSLIVPVYNAEEHLSACLNSISAQEFEDFEVLLVNDGSTDGSANILEEYAAKDSRFRVYSKINTGVSDTRNFGLDHATGKYIQFMDADDWLPKDSMSALVRTMEEKNCDLVIGDFYRVVGESVARKGNIISDDVLSIRDFAEYFMESPADYYYGALWNKLYRASVIRQHHLRFDAELQWCEDFVFNLDYLVYSETVYALRIPVYYYVKTEGSIVAQSMKFGNIVRMKTNIYQYYDRFFRRIMSEEDYEKTRPEIIGFLVAAANDDLVLPFMPGTQKLGSEAVPAYYRSPSECNMISFSYYLSKVLDQKLNRIAQKYHLTLKEIRIMTAYQGRKSVDNIREIADYTGLSVVAVLTGLEKLADSGLIRIDFAVKGIVTSLIGERSMELMADVALVNAETEDLLLREVPDREKESIRKKLRDIENYFRNYVNI